MISKKRYQVIIQYKVSSKRAVVDAKAQRWKQRIGIKSSFNTKFHVKIASVDARAERWNQRSGIKNHESNQCFNLEKHYVTLKLEDEIKEVISSHNSKQTINLVVAQAQWWNHRSGIKSPFNSKFQLKKSLVDAKAQISNQRTGIKSPFS